MGDGANPNVADGYIIGPVWDAQRQLGTRCCLLDAGAELKARDKNGATALRRAVRMRCAADVEFLLQADADRRAKTNPVPLRYTWVCKTTAEVVPERMWLERLKERLSRRSCLAVSASRSKTAMAIQSWTAQRASGFGHCMRKSSSHQTRRAFTRSDPVRSDPIHRVNALLGQLRDLDPMNGVTTSKDASP